MFEKVKLYTYKCQICGETTFCSEDGRIWAYQLLHVIMSFKHLGRIVLEQGGMAWVKVDRRQGSYCSNLYV